MGIETLISFGTMAAGTALSFKGASDAKSASRMEAAAKTHAANIEKIYTEAQLDVQDEQLKQELEEVKLNAGAKVISRYRQAQDAHEANVAWLAGSGVGESMSFQQGIRDANRKVLIEDVQNINREEARASARLADQIRVNKIERIFAGTKTSMIGQNAAINARYEGKAAETKVLGNIVQYAAMPDFSKGLKQAKSLIFG